MSNEQYSGKKLTEYCIQNKK